MELTGLKGVNIEEIVEQENRIVVYISMPVKEHRCPACSEKTTKVHDYRMRKIGHLPMWGGLTISMRIHSVKAKTFKEEETTLVTSISTILRRFTQQAKAVLPTGVRLPKAIGD